MHAGNPDTAREYQQLFEQHPQPMWVVDRESLAFLAVNSAALALYGYSRSEFLQMSVLDLRVAAERERIQERLASGELSSPSGETFWHQRRDGSEVEVELRSHDLDFEGVPARLVMALDVTERRRAERLLDAELRVLESISRGEPLERVLEVLVAGIEAQGRGLLCTIMLREPGRNVLRCAAVGRLPAAFREALGAVPIGPAQGACGTAAHRSEVVLVTDIETDPLTESYRAVTREFGLRACWSQPILSRDGAVLGTFAAYYREPRGPDAHELRVIARAARLAGVALERARTEEVLRHRESEFRALVEHSPDVIARVDPELRFQYVNPAAELATGLLQEDFVGRSLAEIGMPRRRVGAWEQVLSQVVASGQPTTAEFDYPSPTHRRAFQAHLVPELAEDGTVLSVLAVARDISALKQAEVARAAAVTRLEHVLAASPAIIYTLAVEGEKARPDWVTGNLSALLGYTSEEALRPGWWRDHLHPDDRDAAIAGMRRLLVEGSLVHEYRFRHGDGGYRWVRDQLNLVRDAAGRPVEIVGSWMDVTGQRSAEQAVRESEAHYRRLVENSPYGIYALDRTGRFTEVNRAASRILGREPAELLGRHFSEIVASEGAVQFQEVFERTMRGDTPVTDEELYVVRASGERRLIQMRVAPIRDGQASVGVHGVARDITDERARDEQARLLATALERLGQGVSIIDREGQVIYANGAYRRLLGLEGQDTLPSLEEMVPEGEAREQLRAIEAALAGEGHWSGRVWRVRQSDREPVPLDVVTATVERSPGDTLYLTIVGDATETMEQEKRLRRTERLASVGTLLSGVAHELNNPLNAIANFAQLMLMDERSEDDQEALEIVQREAERAAKIVADLRFISRQTQHSGSGKDVVDLNDVVRNTLKLRRYALYTHNVKIEERLAGNLPPLWANRSELEQVVLNLIVNAEHALWAVEGERRLSVRTAVHARGVSLRVEDSGIGIPAENLERIFDPFWTTKAPGEGTGLGLSLVHSIVTEHGGSVRVSSEPGAGATFVVELPRGAPEEVTEPEEREESEPLPAPRKPLRVLVVDDEPGIRRSIRRFLEMRGHQVDIAADGSVALALLEQAGFEYDVILSDLRMPGLGGDGLLARLRERGDDLHTRVIFMTGDAASPEAARLLESSGVLSLTKPVRLTELARIIE